MGIKHNKNHKKEIDLISSYVSADSFGGNLKEEKSEVLKSVEAWEATKEGKDSLEKAIDSLVKKYEGWMYGKKYNATIDNLKNAVSRLNGREKVEDLLVTKYQDIEVSNKTNELDAESADDLLSSQSESEEFESEMLIETSKPLEVKEAISSKEKEVVLQKEIETVNSVEVENKYTKIDDNKRIQESIAKEKEIVRRYEGIIGQTLQIIKMDEEAIETAKEDIIKNKEEVAKIRGYIKSRLKSIEYLKEVLANNEL